MLDLDAIKQRRSLMGTLVVSGEKDTGTHLSNIVYADLQHELIASLIVTVAAISVHPLV